MGKKIKVENKEIGIQIINESEYISLTDMVRGDEGSDHIEIG